VSNGRRGIFSSTQVLRFSLPMNGGVGIEKRALDSELAKKRMGAAGVMEKHPSGKRKPLTLVLIPSIE